MITITIPNLPKIQAVFQKAPVKMTREVRTAIQKSILTIERNAKREAPVNKQTAGGTLRQSIKSEMTGPATGKVQAGASYAAYVEFGTRPHTIRAVNKKTLANRRTGEMFGRVVQHPGTRANNFFERGVKNSLSDIKGFFLKAVENALKL